MHVFRTHIYTEYYKALLSDIEQICDTKSLFHKHTITPETISRIFSITRLSLRDTKVKENILHKTFLPSKELNTLSGTPRGHWGTAARTKHSCTKQPSLEKDTNIIYGWALISASSGTGPQARIQIRLQKAAELHQYQHWYVKAESFTSLQTAIG